MPASSISRSSFGASNGMVLVAALVWTLSCMMNLPQSLFCARFGGQHGRNSSLRNGGLRNSVITKR
jgi:hypothetical protein